MNKSFFLFSLIALVSLMSAFQTDFLKDVHELEGLKGEFAKFKAQNYKSYNSISEELYREGLFRQNFLKMVIMFRNIGQSNEEIKYSPFMDLSEDEFYINYLGLDLNLQEAENQRINSEPLEYVVNIYDETPESMNWQDQGAVTPVKNQGSCGSCWAFSTTGNLEGQSKIVKGELLSLSEQQLVDCDKIDQGCNGGLMENAFNYLKDAGGIETEGDYPYKGTGATCSFDQTKAKIKVESFSFVEKNEDVIKEALFKTGPLAIALNATPLQFYFGGVFHPWKIFCNPETLNHGVLIVGYGTSDKGEPYWLVKNSWGQGWGEKGYFRIYRGDNTCGINSYVVSAKISAN